MGSYLYLQAQKFGVRPEDEVALLAAVPGGQGTVDEAMAQRSWPVMREGDGPINGIEFDGEKYHQEDKQLFEAIAPYVQEGSWLDLECEGDYFRWAFERGALVEYGARIVYDNDPVMVYLRELAATHKVGEEVDGEPFDLTNDAAVIRLALAIDEARLLLRDLFPKEG